MNSDPGSQQGGSCLFQENIFDLHFHTHPATRYTHITPVGGGGADTLVPFILRLKKNFTFCFRTS